MLGSRPIWRVLVDVGDASWRLWLPVIMIIRNQPTTRSTSPWQHRNQSKVPLNPIQFAFTFVQRSFAVNSLNRYHLFGQVWVPFLIRSTMNGDDQEKKSKKELNKMMMNDCDMTEWKNVTWTWVREQTIDFSQALPNERIQSSSSVTFVRLHTKEDGEKCTSLLRKHPFLGLIEKQDHTNYTRIDRAPAGFLTSNPFCHFLGEQIQGDSFNFSAQPCPRNICELFFFFKVAWFNIKKSISIWRESFRLEFPYSKFTTGNYVIKTVKRIFHANFSLRHCCLNYPKYVKAQSNPFSRCPENELRAYKLLFFACVVCSDNLF